jgi:hypothetical protein
VTVSIEPASPVSELVFHGLAWLSVGQHPASLFEPRYHQYSRETLPAECSALLEQDGPLLGARFVERDAIAWHALPVAFETTRALCDFARDPAHRGGLERAIIEPCLRADRDGTEWLALDLAYAARAFERGYERAWRPLVLDACARLRPIVARAVVVDPALEGFSVELSAVLGARGRALGASRLFAGATGLWSAHDETHVAVQLMHERAVRGAGEVDYVCAEWRALVSLARRVQGTEFERAHAAWVATHELRGLAAHAVERGYASPAMIERIAFGSVESAEALRRCPLV